MIPGMPIGEMPSLTNTANSASRSDVSNSFSTGAFNVGTGAGSDGFWGLLMLGAAFIVYVFIANKK